VARKAKAEEAKKSVLVDHAAETLRAVRQQSEIVTHALAELADATAARSQANKRYEHEVAELIRLSGPEDMSLFQAAEGAESGVASETPPA